MATLTAARRTQLRNYLSKHFSADELDTLCADMGEDYDVVPGRGQGELVRAREIINYFEDRGRIERLIMLCAALRPEVNWQALLTPEPAPVAASRPTGIADAQPIRKSARLPIVPIVVLLVLCAGIAAVIGILSSARSPAQVNAPSSTASDRAIAAPTFTAGPPLVTPTTPASVVAATLDAIVPPTTSASPQPPEAMNISNSVGDSERPRLVVDGQGVLHLFWLDNTLRRAKGYDVLHRQRTPDGRWSSAENLTSEYTDVSPYNLTAMNDPSGHTCVLFSGLNDRVSPERYNLHMRCLVESIWSDPKFITQAGTLPAFAPDGNVHVLHTPAEAYLPIFNGIELGDGFGSGGSHVFVIDQDNGYHVAWVQTESPGPYSVRYRFSADGGKTWQSEIKLNDDTNTPGPLYLRAALDRQGRLHLIWAGWDSGAFHRVWTKQTGWGDVTPLGKFGVNGPQELAVDQRDLIHGIENDRLGQVMYFDQQTDGTWKSRMVGPGQAESIALDGQDGRHLAWVRDKDIFYAHLPAGQ